MKRVVPKKHKVQIEFIKGFTLKDLAVLGGGFLLIMMVLYSPIPFKLYLTLFLVAVLFILMADMDGDKGYVALFYLILYLKDVKHYRSKKFMQQKKALDHNNDTLDISDTSEKNIENEDKKNNKKSSNKNNKKNQKQIVYGSIEDTFVNIKVLTDDFIYFKDGNKAFVLDIKPIFFEYLSESEKKNYIEKIYAKCFRFMNIEQTVQVVKLEMPKSYTRFIKDEKKKDKDLVDSFNIGVNNQEETVVRKFVITERIKTYEQLNKDQNVFESKYFIVGFSKNEQSLKELRKNMLDTFNGTNVKVKNLDKYEKAIFLRANFNVFFNVSEAYNIKDDKELVDWIMPNEIDISQQFVKIDGVYTYNFKIGGFPSTLDDGWAKDLCQIPNTRVVFNITPIEHYKAISAIDNSIDELRERSASATKASKIVDTENHLDALVKVLQLLQSSTETLFDVNVFITRYDYERTRIENLPDIVRKSMQYKPVIRQDTIYKLREYGCTISDSFLRQKFILLSSAISKKDYFLSKTIGMYGNLIGASFPFINQHVSENYGVSLGKIDDEPAIFNFFKRDNVHVNSNMMVIGKSGSGKSYFTKVLLSNLLADNCKVFIFDPEDEYGNITRNFYGKSINLSNSKNGIINPFHIIKSIEVDDTDSEQEEQLDAYDTRRYISAHLQFLESFFKILFSGLSVDAFEILNNVTKKLYDVPIIANCSDLDTLKPSDYPIFDDLYNLLLEEKKNSVDSRYMSNIDLIINYLEKFVSGGRNADLWNGYSSFASEENLITFNFQQLIANSNSVIANAQMLLVIHWLNNEIISNKNFNTMYHKTRKIVIIIDEAHVFINEQNPVALDFMFNLAKRIRKYGGMQIVITQNIKDFVGTPEISRKSTAIINASQYSFIFALAPDDLNDLVALYDKSGGINKNEQELILNNERGSAFFIQSPVERGVVKIGVSSAIEGVFDEK